jgi:hypothetical protein
MYTGAINFSGTMAGLPELGTNADAAFDTLAEAIEVMDNEDAVKLGKIKAEADKVKEAAAKAIAAKKNKPKTPAEQQAIAANKNKPKTPAEQQAIAAAAAEHIEKVTRQKWLMYGAAAIAIYFLFVRSQKKSKA